MPRRSRRQRADSLDPVLFRWIVSILIAILALLIALSFFGKAGTVGVILNDYLLSSLFGATRFATPVILLILAFFLVRDVEYDYRATHGIGAIIFFLAVAGFFHLGFEPSDMWREALEGRGGGIFGMAAWPLKQYVGFAASAIILAGLALVSTLLMFNTAIAHFVLFHKKMFAVFGTLGRSAVAAVGALSVSRRRSDGSDVEAYDEAYDDENADEETDEPEETEKTGEEDEGASKRRRFLTKAIQRGDAGDEGDEEKGEISEREETDEEEPELPYRTPKEAAPAADDAAYMKNVVVKPTPSLNLLSSKKGKPTSGDIKENAEIIADTFRQFKIDVVVENIRVGPSVTQYAVRPAKGVKLSKMTGLSNNLALNLAAHPIRIEAPIPGKALVGIEVPNERVARVTLRELLTSKPFRERPHNMMLALGIDVSGKHWFADLPRLPHLLIAGATGSGKTVCINTTLLSLLYQNTAETLRMILVDPKRVELTHYDGIPHLLSPVITNTKQTVNALKWTIGEMERRFDVLSKAGNRDIHSYNQKHPNTRLPHIVFVIDELADLMATAANVVEPGIIRLAQMARAVGIHLILATQRPSVDVITGLMKANIPGRIAFSVASLIDSRTILDASGAEKLLGRGDMLLQMAELSKPVRIQGAFVSEEELLAVTQYLKSGKGPAYDETILDKESAAGGAAAGTLNLFGGPSDDQDPMYDEAKQVIVEVGKASASFLQRKLKIGYARAARILDELEAAGVIGPADGAKPRDILTMETDMGGELNVFDDEDETRNSKLETREEDEGGNDQGLMINDQGAEEENEEEEEEEDSEEELENTGEESEEERY